MKYTNIALMMAAVLVVLLAAGCTSSPEKVSCPISPEQQASNQSDNATVPIKVTEENDRVVPCVGINSSQDGK